MTKNFKELKTTISGFALWVMTGFYFMMPYFSEKHLWHVNNYAVLFGVVSGLLLIIAPDKYIELVGKALTALIGFAFRWMDKKK